MKFHEMISNIFICKRPLSDFPLPDAWWRYLWISLEKLHGEDYEHIWR